MRDIGLTDVINLLKILDIHRGDGLLVHSSIQFLGRPVGGVAMYYQAISQVLSLKENTQAGKNNSDQQQGTLAVPAFNFSFARGEGYDPKTTQSEGMGVFSEYIRQRPEALRTPHPMQSLAIIGRWAEDLVSRDTASAFDPGSAFERMLELDFRLLLLGADIQAVSMVHYSEQRAAVPYRYWKEFTGSIRRNIPGHQVVHSEARLPQHNDNLEAVIDWDEKTYCMYVRNLELDPNLDLSPVQVELEKRGQWLSIPINYGWVSACKLVDFVAITDELLKSNPYSLVSRSDQDGIHNDSQYA